MKKLITLVVILALGVVFASAAWALRQQDKVLEGTVQGIASNILTITILSEDGKRIKEMGFEVNDQTKLEKFSSIEKLKEGDKIQVLYEEGKDKNVAKMITKVGVEENFSENRASATF